MFSNIRGRSGGLLTSSDRLVWWCQHLRRPCYYGHHKWWTIHYTDRSGKNDEQGQTRKPCCRKETARWPNNSNVNAGLQKSLALWTECCVIEVQGHPRLLISVPVECAYIYATSYYWSAVTLDLPLYLSLFQSYCSFLLKKTPIHISSEICGCFPWTLPTLGLLRAKTLG